MISKLSEQNTILAQRLAILENRLREGEPDATDGRRHRRGAYNCEVSNDGLTAQEAEFETILTRLRDEVDRGDRRPGRTTGGLDQYEGRTARGASSSGPSVRSGRSSIGRGRWAPTRARAHPLKSVLRKAMRWYVEPLAVDQRRFNAAVLRLADTLSERDESGRAGLEQHFDAGFDEQRAAAEPGPAAGWSSKSG